MAIPWLIVGTVAGVAYAVSRALDEDNSTSEVVIDSDIERRAAERKAKRESHLEYAKRVASNFAKEYEIDEESYRDEIHRAIGIYDKFTGVLGAGRIAGLGSSIGLMIGGKPGHALAGALEALSSHREFHILKRSEKFKRYNQEIESLNKQIADFEEAEQILESLNEKFV